MELTFSDHESNVIPLPRSALQRELNEFEARIEGLPVTTRNLDSPCRHNRAWVDAQARLVGCRDCEARLDAIEVLAEITRNREQLVRYGIRLRQEAAYLEGEVDRLRREERNAKARIKRAKAANSPK